MKIALTSKYPWNGSVTYTVEPEQAGAEFTFGSPLSGLVPSDAGEGQWHTGFRGSQDRQGLLDDPEKLAAW